MCIDMSSSVARRRLLAGMGVGAAGLALTACSPGGSPRGEDERRFAPPASSGARARVVLLGTAGGPTLFRNNTAGIASALVVDDGFYLIDAGCGVLQQLTRAQVGPEYDEAYEGPLHVLGGIFLTHLHSDHTVDLNNVLINGPFNGLQKVSGVPVWGPGNRGSLPPQFGDGPTPLPANPKNPTPGTVELTEYMLQMYSTDLNDRLFDNAQPHPTDFWEAHDVPVPAEYLADPNGGPAPAMEPFTFFEDDRVKVSATLVDHRPVFPALAYRFDTDDGSVVFSGDTSKCANLVRLAKDADVLVHEVIDEDWAAGMFPSPRAETEEGMYQHLVGSHTLKAEVGSIAADAGVGTLVLSHLVPGDRPESAWEKCGDGFSGRLIVGRDLDVIDVGG